jgi:hypothetical protein
MRNYEVAEASVRRASGETIATNDNMRKNARADGIRQNY